MKTENDKPIQYRAEFTALVETAHQTNKREALAEAHSFAEANANQMLVENHIKGIQSNYAGVLARIKMKLQGETEKAQGLLDQQSAEEEIKKNETALYLLIEEKRIAEADRRRLYLQYNWSNYCWYIILEIFIFGGDTCFNAYSFTVMGGALLFAILPAIAFAVALGLVAYFVPRYIKSLSGRADKILSGLAIGLILLTVFLVIGTLRSMAVLGNGTIRSLGDTSVIAGIAMFTLLNFFLFAGAAILGMSLPSSTDRMTKKEYDQFSKQIDNARREIARLELENRRITEELNRSKHLRIEIVGEEAHFEALVKTLCEETIHAFLFEYQIKKPRSREQYLKTEN